MKPFITVCMWINTYPIVDLIEIYILWKNKHEYVGNLNIKYSLKLMHVCDQFLFYMLKLYNTIFI